MDAWYLLQPCLSLQKSVQLQPSALSSGVQTRLGKLPTQKKSQQRHRLITSYEIANEAKTSLFTTTSISTSRGNMLLRDESLLPASHRTAHDDLVDPSQDLAAFLSKELDLTRLSRIQDHLWLAGRPMPPRPLHHQRVLGRDIIITEKMDMHLVWQHNRIFLKPIPRYLLLEPSIWSKYLACKDECAASNCADTCERAELRKCAMGLLFSYAGLIMYESDYHIAQGMHLIPAEISWPAWRGIVSHVLNASTSWAAVDTTTTAATDERDPKGIQSSNPPSLCIYDLVPPRFHYGELRLSRLNKIYRLSQRPFLRGYMWGWNTYSTFFGDNLTLLASATVYLAIVLTAMQVGLSTTRLIDSKMFQDASVGFTIFSIVTPLGAAVLILITFLYLVVSNLIVAVAYKKRRLRHIERLGTSGLSKLGHSIGEP